MDTKMERHFTEAQLLIIETARRLLADLRQQLISDIRLIIVNQKASEEKQWLKSSEARKLLGISHGTLQTLRNNSKIPFTKIGGGIYYSKVELDKLMSSKSFQTFK